MATLEEALQGLNYTGADTGYGIAAQTLGQVAPSLINPYGSTGQALGIGLGSVLLQSLLGYQARQEAARSTLELNSLANQLMTKTTPEARTEFIGGVSDPMNQSRLSTLSTALMQQEAARKINQANKLADLTTAAEFETSPLATQVADLKATREAEAKRKLVQALVPSGSVSTAGAEAAPMPGATEMQQKRDALITRGIAMGMTPNAALEYAEKNTKFETKATGEAGKKIEASRSRGINLEEIAATARAGMEGAGMTGGILAGPRQLASRVAAVVNPNEQEKQDFQKVLDSVKPRIVQILRSPGAVTEMENKLLIGAGPSSNNTPTENARIIAGMETIAQLEQDYADFLEAFVTQKGNSIGADPAWRQYKSEQVFPAGTFNPQRQDWASWMAEKGGVTSIGMANVNAVQQSGAELVSQLKSKYGADWKTKLTDIERTTLKTLVDAAKGQ
jgi:hypothetical protein